MNKKPIKHTESSGNVYQDLGFVDAEARLAKANLAMRITDIIEKKKWKQIDAAEKLGINQPKISALTRGQLSGFSIERLIHFLRLLNQNVEIVVRNNSMRHKAYGYLKVICRKFNLVASGA
ncbi:MAG: helix-turn-helix transcriptional regulator [Pseudomonadota bacterium]|nr:helix-turn-helix domain-containing protein [Gammaproteobacteria bacterium]MBU1558613.1 helix-turn-helix domain-containing protein [Gammaproteobacteria bacterium]MBU1927095.1 helix-turn-helix domain-containing protein [Gammaproteobacteria bacterium]MBU2546463.1 helix-turn-helix domain-containing protein [Gammaproteobacteria bacterium]